MEAGSFCYFALPKTMGQADALLMEDGTTLPLLLSLPLHTAYIPAPLLAVTYINIPKPFQSNLAAIWGRQAGSSPASLGPTRIKGTKSSNAYMIW